ncbi:hypothetical protein GQ54DRAFT_309113 [Martensiomyces pterosporus]|nr:hypothetical protein GQ54DRAFT_309113 [Martensiomyces pterosporus]
MSLRSEQQQQQQQQQHAQQPHSLEADRCWICLDDLRKNRREWLYPCKCSLICHETCLLHWIGESERRSRTGVVRCPQCNTPYKIVQWHSKTFNALNSIYDLVDRSMPFFLATIGSMAVVVACTAYGAYTVMTVYGPVEGHRILGGPGRWDHTKWVWLPMIPLTLIWSRFQAGAAYMPLSTLIMTTPHPLRAQWPISPSLALTALPTVSALYRYVWDMTLGRLERRWESRLPPEQRALTVRRFGMQQPLLQPQAGANNDNEAVQPRANRNFEATIVLNGSAFGRTLVESLLLPVISTLCGSAIAKLPFVQRRGLSHFSRTIIGGCAYFLVKDLVRVFYKYLLYQTRVSRFIQGRKRF